MCVTFSSYAAWDQNSHHVSQLQYLVVQRQLSKGGNVFSPFHQHQQLLPHRIADIADRGRLLLRHVCYSNRRRDLVGGGEVVIWFFHPLRFSKQRRHLIIPQQWMSGVSPVLTAFLPGPGWWWEAGLGNRGCFSWSWCGPSRSARLTCDETAEVTTWIINGEAAGGFQHKHVASLDFTQSVIYSDSRGFLKPLTKPERVKGEESPHAPTGIGRVCG